MHQDFVKNFLDEYLKGEDISRLRREFDRELEKYINERCAEKLEKANKLIAEIEKIDMSDPFFTVRNTIIQYKEKY